MDPSENGPRYLGRSAPYQRESELAGLALTVLLMVVTRLRVREAKLAVSEMPREGGTRGTRERGERRERGGGGCSEGGDGAQATGRGG